MANRRRRAALTCPSVRIPEAGCPCILARCFMRRMPSPSPQPLHPRSACVLPPDSGSRILIRAAYSSGRVVQPRRKLILPVTRILYIYYSKIWKKVKASGAFLALLRQILRLAQSAAVFFVGRAYNIKSRCCFLDNLPKTRAFSLQNLHFFIYANQYFVVVLPCVYF